MWAEVGESISPPQFSVHPGASTAKLIVNATKEHVPLMAIIGAQEVAAGTLSMRGQGGVQYGALPRDEVIDRICAAVAQHADFSVA